MSLTDFAQLAADCEARAKAGEKPVMEWVGVDDYLDRYQGQKFCWLVQMSGQTIVGITRALDGHGGRESAWSVNHLPLAGTPRFAIERTIAAQLFAEALLADATAPLHAARVKALEDQLDGRRIKHVQREALELGEALSTPVLPAQVPDGSVAIGGWLLDGTYYIVGEPDEETDPDHDCDAMGCGLCHIVDHAKSTEAQDARIAALEAALAEAKDVACAERNRLDGEQATRWNDLAVRWQDALAGDATKGSAE